MVTLAPIQSNIYFNGALDEMLKAIHEVSPHTRSQSCSPEKCFVVISLIRLIILMGISEKIIKLLFLYVSGNWNGELMQ